MGARDFRDLVVWRLGREIKIEVYKLTKVGTYARDFRLRNQTNDAASSICSNIAEGFGRISHREFVRFLEISSASLQELQNHLIDACDRGHVIEADIAQIRTLCERWQHATARFIAYLRRTPTPTYRRHGP